MSEQLLEPIAAESAHHRVVSMLEHTHAEEIFRTPEMVHEYLKQSTFEEFESLLIRLNGMNRNLPVGKRAMDGTGVVVAHNAMMGWSITEYVPPIKDDRKPLMRSTFEAVQSIDDTERAATLLGLAINAIHPFQDGNGRTSRFCYSLLTKGYDGSEESKQYYDAILGNLSGRELVDLNPEHMRLASRYCTANRKKIAATHDYDGVIPNYAFGGYGDAVGEDYNTDTLEAPATLSEWHRKRIHDVLSDKYFDATVLMDYLLDTDPEGFPGYIKSFDNGIRNPLVIDDLVHRLDDETVNDIAKRHATLKRGYIEAIVTVLADNDSSPTAQGIVAYFRPSEKTVAA